MSCALLRERWRGLMTGEDAEEGTAAAGSETALEALAASAEAYGNAARRSREQPGCLGVWPELAGLPSYGFIVHRACTWLRTMALAYATPGCRLCGDEGLLDAARDILRVIVTEDYCVDRADRFRLWWFAELGIPLQLNDCFILLEGKLPEGWLEDYARTVLHFSPDPVHYHYTSAAHRGTKRSTGANRLWKCTVHVVLGALLDRAELIRAAAEAAGEVLVFAEEGDGFHRDGSFIQHDCYAYNGGYGKSMLALLAKLLNVLKASEWAVTHPGLRLLPQWIDRGFLPLVFEGAIVDMCRGREIAREHSEAHQGGHELIYALLELIEYAEYVRDTSPAGLVRSQEAEQTAAEAAASETAAIAQAEPPGRHSDAAFDVTAVDRWKRYVRHWIRADTFRPFYAHAPVRMIGLARRVEREVGELLAEEASRCHVYGAMARAVLLRPGFAFTVSMYSSRIASYECITNVNRRGWHTGFGMTQLYTGAPGLFSEGFWPTVDPYRLAGTTAERRPLPEEYGAGRLSGRSWAGGADLGGSPFGIAAMELEGYPEPEAETGGAEPGSEARPEQPSDALFARKSWFLWEDLIVCLGSDIRSASGAPVETIVDNRPLPLADAPFAPGLSFSSSEEAPGRDEASAGQGEERRSGQRWLHWPGAGDEEADIGYFFPESASIMVVKERRSGRWPDIGQGSPQTVTRDYVTLVLEHGVRPQGSSYCYAIVPGATKAGMEQFAARPSFEVLELTEEAHAVRQADKGLLGIHFWGDRVKKVGPVACGGAAAVLLRETEDRLELAVADPTQNGTLPLELVIDCDAVEALALDPAIAVQELAPRLRLTVSVRGAQGRSLRAVFLKRPRS